MFKFLRQDDAAEVRGDAAGLPRACKLRGATSQLEGLPYDRVSPPPSTRREPCLVAATRPDRPTAAPELDRSKTYTIIISPPPAHFLVVQNVADVAGRPCGAGCRCAQSPMNPRRIYRLGANFCSACPQRSGHFTSSSVPCMIKTLEDTFAIFSWFTKISIGLRANEDP